MCLRWCRPGLLCFGFVLLALPLKRSLPLLLPEEKPPLCTPCATEPLNGKARSPCPDANGKSFHRGPATQLIVLLLRQIRNPCLNLLAVTH